MKVLIPAMEKRSALVAARSLGDKGSEVVGCSHQKFNPGFFSKYCKKKYLYHSPFSNVQKYLKDIYEIIEKEKPEIFLPINEETLLPLLADRENFEKLIKLSLPPNDVLDKVFDKISATKIAKDLNIPCPEEGSEFPMVARPIQSRRIEKGKVVADKFFYVKSKEDLSGFNSNQFFLQEYIPGLGYGFYALFDQGKPVAYFMLKRIHEVPFSGGPSSLRESVYEEKLKEYGLRILKALNWHGLAMVEFRRDDRDNLFKFIEINARLWGSLALSIYAGIDFPYLLCASPSDAQAPYRVGAKGRWFFGEVSYLLSVFFGKKVDKRPPRIKSLLEFFDFFQPDMCYDYFTKNDLKPALINSIISFGKLFKKICKLKA